MSVIIIPPALEALPRVHVPPPATWLGVLGALPFVALAPLVVWLDAPLGEVARTGLMAYGAVILSFLGGVHWGMAIARSAAEEGEGSSLPRLAASVVPALMGWLALLLPGAVGGLVLMASFAAMLAYDLNESRVGRAPSWYPRLRWPLTLIVVGSLLAGSLV